MVMGDLVLLDQEVPAVMSGLLAGGPRGDCRPQPPQRDLAARDVTCTTAGHGDAVQMAARASVRHCPQSGTPLGGGTGRRRTGPPLRRSTRKRSSRRSGRSGRDMGAGVFQVTVPRAEAITEMGQALLPAMGVVTVLNFQPTSDGQGRHHGVIFVLIDKEVNTVAKTLRQHGWST